MRNKINPLGWCLIVLATVVASWGGTITKFNPFTGKPDIVATFSNNSTSYWGTIAGTITEQSDLQGALGQKLPAATFNSYTSIDRVTNEQFSAYTSIDRAGGGGDITTAQFNTFSTATQNKLNLKLSASVFTSYTSAGGGRATNDEVSGTYQKKTSNANYTYSTNKVGLFGMTNAGYAWANYSSYTKHAWSNYSTNNASVPAATKAVVKKSIASEISWAQSLDRIEEAFKQMAAMGVRYVSEKIMPDNFYSKWTRAGSPYFASCGPFNYSAADGWAATDLVVELARKYGMKIHFQNLLGEGSSWSGCTKQQMLDNVYLPSLTYFAQRYADYSDVIAGIEWAAEIYYVYGAGATSGYSDLNTSNPYNMDPSWIDHHIAVYDAIKAVAPNIEVTLPSSVTFEQDSVGSSTSWLTQIENYDRGFGAGYAADGVLTVDKIDAIALDWYWSYAANRQNFQMANDDPLDLSGYWGADIFGNGLNLQQNIETLLTKLDSVGRPDLNLVCGQCGGYAVSKGTVNMAAGSGVVTYNSAATVISAEPLLILGSQLTIGDDTTIYTVTSVTNKASGEITVSPVNSGAAKVADRFILVDWLDEDADGIKWMANYLKDEPRVDYWNWWQLWGHSSQHPMQWNHYGYPYVSNYAQNGTGFVETNTLKKNYRANALIDTKQKEVVNAAAIQGRPVIFTNYTTGQVLKFDASGNIVNGEDTGGTGSLPASLTADETNETLTQASTVESNTGNPIASFNVTGVFNGGTGAIATFENTFTGTPGTPLLLRRSRSGGTSVNGDSGGTVRYQFHNGSAYFTAAELSARLLDVTTGATALSLSTQNLGLGIGNVINFAIGDEKQNLHVGRNSAISSVDTGGGAASNLILNNTHVTAPTAGVSDAVALYASDLNGAGTTGLNIRTEDDKTISVGTTAAGTGLHLPSGASVYVDGVQLSTGSPVVKVISPAGTIAAGDTSVLLTGTDATTITRLTDYPATNGFAISIFNGNSNAQTIAPLYAGQKMNYVADASYSIPAGKGATFVYMTGAADAYESWYVVEDGNDGSSQWTTATNDIYYTTGKVLVGTTTADKTLTVSEAAGIAASLERRSTANATSPAASLVLRNNANVDVGDGFGTAINGVIRDDTATTDQNIGQIGFARAGADNTGAIWFRPAVAGTFTTSVVMKPGGVVRFVPIATPASCELGDTYVNSSDNKMYSCTTAGTPGTWTAHW